METLLTGIIRLIRVEKPISGLTVVFKDYHTGSSTFVIGNIDKEFIELTNNGSLIDMIHITDIGKLNYVIIETIDNDDIPYFHISCGSKIGIEEIIKGNLFGHLVRFYKEVNTIGTNEHNFSEIDIANIHTMSITPYKIIGNNGIIGENTSIIDDREFILPYTKDTRMYTKEEIIILVTKIRDNYSTNVSQESNKPLPKQKWRKDFTNEIFDIEEIINEYTPKIK
jgi:hypothetical protein